MDLHYKTLKGKIVALENLSLKVKESEFLAIVGPSGCGKTTLLKIISGLLSPTNGTVKIRGKIITRPYPGVSMCFQSPVLLDWRTARDNIHLPLEILYDDEEERAKYEKNIADLLSLVRLEDFSDKYPFELSGGMQQRVSIARALITDPELLLMDEPFGALDAFTREELGKELIRIWKATKKTIVYVTHNIPESVLTASKVVVMSSRPGRIIDEIQINLERPRDEHCYEFDEICKVIKRQICL